MVSKCKNGQFCVSHFFSICTLATLVRAFIIEIIDIPNFLKEKLQCIYVFQYFIIKRLVFFLNRILIIRRNNTFAKYFFFFYLCLYSFFLGLTVVSVTVSALCICAVVAIDNKEVFFVKTVLLKLE